MTPLSEKMHALLPSLPPEQADKMRTLATAFDNATSAHAMNPSEDNVKKMLGAWARARRCYCEISGESLL